MYITVLASYVLVDDFLVEDEGILDCRVVAVVKQDVEVLGSDGVLVELLLQEVNNRIRFNRRNCRNANSTFLQRYNSRNPLVH